MEIFKILPSCSKQLGIYRWWCARYQIFVPIQSCMLDGLGSFAWRCLLHTSFHWKWADKFCLSFFTWLQAWWDREAGWTADRFLSVLTHISGLQLLSNRHSVNSYSSIWFLTTWIGSSFELTTRPLDFQLLESKIKQDGGCFFNFFPFYLFLDCLLLQMTSNPSMKSNHLANETETLWQRGGEMSKL